MITKKLLALAGAAALTATLAACGGGGDESGSGSGESWILGTTDKVTSLDPAGAYDLGSWTLMFNMYQRLLTIPPGENQPAGDAAEECDYEDPKTFKCTLKDGLTFANGNELTSSDVKYSLERNIKIADPNGAASMLGSIMNKNDKVDPDAIETPDDSTIIFHLNRPDTTFQYVLTTNAAAIVDEDTFPENKLIGDEDAVGSGPFKMEQYKDGQQAVLVANGEYNGANEAESEKVFVQYFQEPSGLKQAISGGEVDVAWRSLSPTDVTDLEDNDSVKVYKGDGSEIRYWVWQLDTDAGGEKAIRQASANILDREEIAKNAYSGIVEPLYSIVPPGLAGHKASFKDKWGAEPDVDAAKKLLDDAGVDTPVDLTIGYTPSHYGPNMVDEANEVKRELEDSGLFKVKVKSAEWTQYQDLYKENAYDMFALGWFPDFLDADNYLTPFLVDGGFYQNNYDSDKAKKLINEELSTTDTDARNEVLGQVQDLAAEDVPLVPSWVGKNIAIASPDMKGVEETLGAEFIFRMWSVTKEG